MRRPRIRSTGGTTGHSAKGAVSLRALALGLVLLAGACGGGDAPPLERDPRELDAPPAVGAPPRAVLLLALDGLRHDDLSDPGLTPHLVALRDRSLDYVDHCAANLGLNAALCSALTGLEPVGGRRADGTLAPGHGVGSLHGPGGARLAPGVTTLAERAAADGRATLAAVARVQLHDDLSGLRQGFAAYDAPPPEPDHDLPAESILALVRPGLERALAADEPVLAWLQLSDLERPAEPDPAHARERLRLRLAPFADRVPAAVEALGRASLTDEQALAEVRTLLGRARGSEAHTAMRLALREARLAQLDRVLGAWLAEVEALAGEGGLGLVLWSPRGALVTPPRSSAGPAFPPEMVRTPLWVCAPGIEGGTLRGCLTSAAVFDAAGALLGLAPGLPDPDPSDRVRVGDPRLEHVAWLDRAGQVEGHVRARPAAFDRAGERVVLGPVEAGEPDPHAGLRDLLRTWEGGLPETGLRLVHGGDAPLEVRWRVLDGLAGPARVHGADGAPVEGAASVQGLGGRADLGPGETLELEGSRQLQGLRVEFTGPGGTPEARGPWAVPLPVLRHDAALPLGDDDPSSGAPVVLRVEGGWVHVEVAGDGEPVRGELHLFPPLGVEPAPLEWGGDPALDVRPVPGRDDALAFEGRAPTTLSLRLPGRTEPALWVERDGRVLAPWELVQDGVPLGTPDALRLLVPPGAALPPADPTAVPSLERRDPPLAGGPAGPLDPHLRAVVRRLPASE